MAQLKATTVNGNLTVTGGNISGNLNAGQLNSGTVPEGRLIKATTSVYGITKLNNATNSTSTSEAATAASVKAANDNANSRLKLDGTTTMTGQLKVNGANGINFGDNDTITYNDTDNRFEFKADNGTSSKVKAGTFEGALSGKASTAGTADQANKWTSARSITLGGDLTGAVAMDGTANVTLNAEVKNDSHTHSSLTSLSADIPINTSGRGLSWSVNTDIAKINFKNNSDSDTDSYLLFETGDNGNEYFKFNQVNGANSVELASIKSDHLRFKGNAVYHAANKPPQLATARQINGTNFDGSNSITTAKWGNARTITLGGDLSGSVSIDGSANVTLSGQVTNDSHNHTVINGHYHSSIILNDHSNGNVTLAAAKNSGGTVGDLYVGYNSGNHTTKDVLLCKNMKWQSSGATLVDSNGKIPWSALTGLPSTWAPSSHTHDDRYYTEGEMNTKLDGKSNTSGSYAGLRTGKTMVHDTRGANRPPSYYDRQSVRYDFVEGSQIGYSGNWNAVMTISPWTSWNATHRQSQIAFCGDNMGFRYATSDTAWSSWRNFLWNTDVDTNSTANKIAKRDGAGDINCRLLRTNYQDENRLTGGIMFRVNNSSDNFSRVCSSPSAARGWLGAAGISGGAHIFCQTSQPAATKTGDIWIKW